MKVTPINDYKDIHQDKETVLVLGYFDALHRGHKVLFDKARQIADEKQLEVAVLTFNESPQLTFQRYTDDLLLHITAPQILIVILLEQVLTTSLHVILTV